MPTEHFDVAVIGGGLVGSTAALALARTRRRVALVERRPPAVARGRLGFDARTVALSPASLEWLGTLTNGDAIECQTYERVRVWEETGTAAIEFRAGEAGVAHLGAIAEVSPTVSALWQRCMAEEGISCRLGEVADVRPGAAGVTVSLGDDTALGADLLVAADGADSAVRRVLGVAAMETVTGHDAIASVVVTERFHDGTAFQRFLGDAPVALLPLPDREHRHHAALVWSQTPAAASERMALDDGVFVAELSRAVEHVLGAVTEVDRRFRFPLVQRVAEDLNPVPGIVLIGDAARLLHPLAGQGVNIGFEDARLLAEHVAAVPAGVALSDLDLAGYARRRRAKARAFVLAMDGFRRIYGAGDPARTWLRNLGVAAVNDSRMLKTALMREAMGLGASAR